MRESDIEKLDYICITHGHADHCASAIPLAKKTGAKVVAINELTQLLVKDGLSNTQVETMDKGGILMLGEDPQIGIALTQAIHSSAYQAADGQNHYAGDACGFIIQLESGRTIYYSGDTTIFGDMELIGDLFTPTVALLSIGGRFSMDPFLAAHATSLIESEYVIPIHYETYDTLPGKVEEFCQYLNEMPGVSVKPLKPGEEFSF
ncbi:MAG: metal-dependent hydrolase [Deltaproteobacteria bacterium]|nr:metal-dependent hydrolase [Deltaproteobacteria bacterium]